MLHKVRGVVFRFTKYGETSIIVSIFTDSFGLQSYIVNGVRSKASKNKIALYQPLTLLQLVVYHREQANIERIKEASCYHPYSTLATDIRKSSIALFIGEIINKTVKEEAHVDQLFDFISTSLITLDTLTENFENFHLHFLLRLSRYLGFGAVNAHEISGPIPVNDSIHRLIERLLVMKYGEPLMMKKEQRKEILDLLINYYSSHVENFGDLKSLSVLREVLS